MGFTQTDQCGCGATEDLIIMKSQKGARGGVEYRSGLMILKGFEATESEKRHIICQACLDKFAREHLSDESNPD